jgi:hypothetical protein
MAVEQQTRSTSEGSQGESLEVAALRRQLAEQERKFTRIIAEKDQALVEKDQIITAQSRQVTEMEEYQHQVHSILTNKDMSYRDRVVWGVTHIVHGKDIMAGRPFHANMAQIQTMSGSGKNGTGELFSAMVEAGGVKHDWNPEKYQPEGSEQNKWSSAVMITALPGNALVNTKAAAVRVRQRENAAQSATRRVERLISLAIEACPNCGCTDPEQAQTLLVPRCNQCGKLRNSDNLVQTSALRIVEIQEEPVQIEIETSSAQAVAVSSEAPTSQDTPSVDDYASELTEIPDEPADIKAQYEEQAPLETEITPTDIQRFQSAKAIFTTQGLDRPSGLGSFTFGDIVNEMQKIMNNPERNEGQVRWLRQGINSALSKGGQRWRETT